MKLNLGTLTIKVFLNLEVGGTFVGGVKARIFDW